MKTGLAGDAVTAYNNEEHMPLAERHAPHISVYVPGEIAKAMGKTSHKRNDSWIFIEPYITISDGSDHITLSYDFETHIPGNDGGPLAFMPTSIIYIKARLVREHGQWSILFPNGERYRRGYNTADIYDAWLVTGWGELAWVKTQ